MGSIFLADVMEKYLMSVLHSFCGKHLLNNPARCVCLEKVKIEFHNRIVSVSSIHLIKFKQVSHNLTFQNNLGFQRPILYVLIVLFWQVRV